MPKDKEQWTITIDSFGGFSPAWFDNTWTAFGNKSQASAMVNANIIDPNVLTQGAGAVDLTSGDENGELGSVLITSILKHATASSVTYACGADKVFKITPTAVSNGNFPKTISAGTANVSTSLLYYKTKVFVFWNDTGVDGDIGLLTNDTTWDDNWGSTVPTGAAQLEDAPHYGIVGGDDVMYYTNGRYIGNYDGTTLDTEALDFWTDSEVVSLTWNQNRIWAAVNRPNITGSNFNQSGIYKWNGVSSSWEGDPVEVPGEIGALYTKNGITFVWWADSISTGAFWLGYVSGGQLVPLRRFTGSLPNQDQAGEHKGFLMWVTDNKVYLWGARDVNIPVRLFHYMSGKHATIGAIAAPFGELLVSSYAGANYSLAKESGYTVTSSRKSVVFNVSGADFVSQIDLIKVETEQMSTGAKVDITITYNQGKSTKATTQIAYAAANKTRHKILNGGPANIEDFRIDVDWANGSATNPVKIRSIMVQGHYIKQN